MAALELTAGQVIKAVDAANNFRLENLSNKMVFIYYTDSDTVPSAPTSDDAWGTIPPGKIEIRAGGVDGNAFVFCDSSIIMSVFESAMPA